MNELVYSKYYEEEKYTCFSLTNRVLSVEPKEKYCNIRCASYKFCAFKDDDEISIHSIYLLIEISTDEDSVFFDLILRLGDKTVSYNIDYVNDLSRNVEYQGDQFYVHEKKVWYKIGVEGLEDICEAPSIDVKIKHKPDYLSSIEITTLNNDGLQQTARVFYNALVDDSMYVNDVKPLVAEKNKERAREKVEDFFINAISFIFIAVTIVLCGAIFVFFIYCFIDALE